MLRIENLDVFHGDAQALDDVSLDIAEGPPEAVVREPAVVESYLGAEAVD